MFCATASPALKSGMRRPTTTHFVPARNLFLPLRWLGTQHVGSDNFL